MGHLHFEAVSPIPRQRLFLWYVDFSEKDPALSAKYGDGSLKERRVTRLDDRHFSVESVLDSRGRKFPVHYDVTINPEEFTYNVTLTSKDLYKIRRRYAFLETSEGGTRVVVDDDYTLLRNLHKFLDLFGQGRRMLLRSSQEVMQTYLKAAQEELAPKKGST